MAVRLCDRAPVKPLSPNESFVRARLENGTAMRKACRGAETLLHLGGAALEAGWTELFAANVNGLSVAIEAARAEGARRIVFASSLHVLGMHERSAPVDEDSPVAPDSRYAATKAFGEAACRLLADRHGMSVVILRIGHVVERMEEAAPGFGISAGDLRRLARLALAVEGPGCRMWHAVAPHEGYGWSDGRLERDFGFGFEHPGPDRAEIERRMAGLAHLGPAGRACRGGDFADNTGRPFAGWTG